MVRSVVIGLIASRFAAEWLSRLTKDGANPPPPKVGLQIRQAARTGHRLGLSCVLTNVTMHSGAVSGNYKTALCRIIGQARAGSQAVPVNLAPGSVQRSVQCWWSVITYLPRACIAGGLALIRNLAHDCNRTLQDCLPRAHKVTSARRRQGPGFSSPSRSTCTHAGPTSNII